MATELFPDGQEPEDLEAVIWRFMKLAKFRDLIGTSELYFRRADLFPDGRAPLVVCNPPWLPGRPSSPLVHAIYDEDNV